ncbi:putative ribonuclease H-like domain-containing protein [Tanacetum coccineum]
MQKYILKQQFEGFSVSNSEGLHKGYDRFQSLLSQLEIHGAGVSTEDANKKFLRSLPSAWSQVSLIMRTKPGVDSLSFDDLYNNLRVFKNDVKGSTASSSSSQNVAFVSENTNSTNDVSTAYSVSNTSKQLDEYDLEEMDLKWQVAMISMRMKKVYKKTGRKLQFDAKEPVGFDKTKVESTESDTKDNFCTNKLHISDHYIEPTEFEIQEMDYPHRALKNKGIVDSGCSRHMTGNKAYLAEFQDFNGGPVTFGGSKGYITGKGKIKMEQVSTVGGKRETAVKPSAGCNWRPQRYHGGSKYNGGSGLRNCYTFKDPFPQLDHEDLEKIVILTLKKDLKWQVAMISMRMKKFYKKTGRKLQFDVKEPVGFDKTKVECYNCHKSGHFARECRIKGTQDNRRRDAWNSGNKDGSKQDKRKESKALGDASIEIKAYSQGLKKVEAQLVAHQQGQLWFVTEGGMHDVPPPMTGNYMPSGPDIEVDYSQFTYGTKQTQPSESESQSSEFDTCESNISTEPSELVSEPIVNESNVECQPKVWSDAPIIEECELDSEDEYVSIPTKQQETPSFANQQVKTPRENIKSQYTQKPKVDKKDLGHGFAVRACFVCGSLNHLIRDCDFHEKRMARKTELNNGWNNVQRVNKQNQFVPSAVLTRTGIIPVNTARTSSTKNFSTARQSVNRQTVLTSTTMKVNTVKHIMNRVRPVNVFL